MLYCFQTFIYRGKIMSNKKMNIETTCVQGGYTPQNGEPRQVPIIQSTTPYELNEVGNK